MCEACDGIDRHPLPEHPVHEHIEAILRHIEGVAPHSPLRDGMLETPARYAKALDTWFGGYTGPQPEEILKTFEDGADGCDQLVLVGPIPFWSHCEHHVAPFFGDAWIGYIPNKRIVGLSKLARLLDCFARRLQVQERITNQVADALQDNLEPIGVGVMIRARHSCMESRGVQKMGSFTTTTAFRGALLDEASARAEFFSSAGG